MRSIFLILSVSCCIHCVAQNVDTSFTLLWYKGKRLDDTTLLTTGGQTITFSPSKGTADVKTPPEKDIFNNLKRSISTSEERKVAIDRHLTSLPNRMQLIGMVQDVNRAMDQATANAEKLTETKLELTDDEWVRPPEDPMEKSFIPPNIQRKYYEVLAAVDAVKKEEPPPPPPVPPTKEPDYCFPCDAQRREKYSKDSLRFMQYVSEQDRALNKAFQVIGYFYGRGIMPGDSATVLKMQADMYDAMQRLFRNIGRKLRMAWLDYSDEATHVEFLALVCTAHIRKQQLTGLPLFPSFPTLDEMAQKCLDAGNNYFAKAMKDRNYKVLLNIQWIIGLMRTPELLGMPQKDLEYGIENFINLNTFNVTVDAHATMVKDGTNMSATIHGESVYGAVPDSNCVLHWVLLAPDTAKMLYDLQDEKLHIGKKKATYTGTRKWKSYPADLRLDFCHQEKDTAFLYGFFPTDGEESWSIDGKPANITAVIPYIFSLSFMDIKRMQAMAADPTLQARMMQEMSDKYKEFTKNLPANRDPSKMSPQQMEQMGRAMSSARDLKAMIHPTLPTSFLCRGHLKNGDKVVLETTLNGKELFPENTAIQEAVLTLKIEHAGNMTPRTK